MEIVTNVLIVVALLASVMLILVVVVQKSKGGGLASGFASANNIVGAHKSTDMLEKLTWWFFGSVAVLCVVVSMFLFSGGSHANDGLQNAIERQAAEQAPAVSPGFGGNAPTVATAPATPAEVPAIPAEQPATPEAAPVAQPAN